MGEEIRYGKPCMTNLPADLGRKIFDEILSSPLPDLSKIKIENEILVKNMVAERDREDAQRNSTE